MLEITIPPFDEQAAQTAQERLDVLAKLPGSLGKLEELAVHLAGITGQACPSFPHKKLVLFAGDHDIALHGLSFTGQEVTAMQVRNFLQGGGTINAFCRTAHADVQIVDVGVKEDLQGLAGLTQCNVMHAAHDFSQGAAMSREQAVACLSVGMAMARQAQAEGCTLLAAGEMGIGNTSPSAAIISVLTGQPVAAVAGMGSGIAAPMIQRKVECITRGIELNQPNAADPLDVLAKVGGTELAAMAGFMLGGAALRIPVVVDGFIAGAAAAIAVALQPAMRSMLIGSHCSAEPGHQIVMDYLGIPTYLDLGMRLGEGTGAVLLFPIIDSAVRILHEMKTRKDIGLSC
ncbi:MAG: nicotinate-nucleotide--dimethylbenzimidazole phosphoribosyltransferase [Desulfovibrionaceae bacterium]|nr:nicotinate-nucleotide--dimethylbenzimidazole phosphoribosyltransferase [Desulfovibrionaceae bacterium]